MNLGSYTLLDMDKKIRFVLGVRVSETIEEAARRVVKSRKSSVMAKAVAREILGPGEPWTRMYKAMAKARPMLVSA